ncbi:MAG: DGQHR domain-containing protein [Caldilineaceae bacterium]|nr:DGQHR domain-containing protein [Caldilineaceae bacterium]MDE0336874.1 DGQHR domain-containing protein [Caldilineaceae bacterium]
MGIQRGFEEDRSRTISSFVRAGFPWASLGASDRELYPGLRKPGWLPTALILNMVKPETVRGNERPRVEDLIRVEESGPGKFELVLPQKAESKEWQLAGKIHPLEVIDGQHRLLAFGEGELEDENFDLPVVLFEDLDVSWQAYLFWTINITPKRISPSLAYDLYPLLRTEDWLEPVAGPMAYREARAQELTEALWMNPESPWCGRISMLGRERGKVSQAAFVRSLTLSFVRRSDARGQQPGGLFGSPLSERPTYVLSWSRAQQAAYLIYLWSELEREISESSAPWAQHVRDRTETDLFDMLEGERDPAFVGRYSLLSTDQGVRGFLQVSNDLSFELAEKLELNSWFPGRASEATNEVDVSEAILEIRSLPKLSAFVRELCQATAQFDWRSMATPGLTEEERNRQALYRAGTGYREVRRNLLLHLSRVLRGQTKEKVDRVIRVLRYGS